MCHGDPARATATEPVATSAAVKGRYAGVREAPITKRAVWCPPPYAWILIGLVALALTPEIVPGRLKGHWLFITPCVIVAGVLVARKLWELPPFVTMCAAIVLTIFSGAWSQMGLGGLPFDRLLVVMVLLMFFLRAPGIAHTPRLQIRNVHLLLCVAIIYVLISAVAAGTLTNETAFLSLIDQVGVMPYLIFLVAPAVFAGQRERNILLATLVVLGAYLGLTAIFESLGPHSLVFPRYIVNVDTATPGGRAYGPFQGSVAEGFATFACAVAGVMAFAKWQGPLKRGFAVAVAVVCILGCFLTLERGVWIAAAAGIAVTALATREGRRWLIPIALACTFLIGGALLISPSLASKTSARAYDEQSVWDRQNQTSAGIRMLQAKPLFGFGWGRYTSDSLPYFRQANAYPMNGYQLSQLDDYDIGVGSFEKPLPLHDTYLSFAVELGMIGALLWLASLLWGVGGAIFSSGPADLRSWKLGLLAIAVFFLAVGVVNPYQAPFPALLLWLWAGVALGGASLQAQEQRAKIAAQLSEDVVWTPAANSLLGVR